MVHRDRVELVPEHGPRRSSRIEGLTFSKKTTITYLDSRGPSCPAPLIDLDGLTQSKGLNNSPSRLFNFGPNPWTV